MTRLVSLAAAFVAVSWIGMLGGDPPGTLHAGQSPGASQREKAPVGNVAAGKARWNEQECAFCHGLHGQGGYGPDLAGLGLTFEQFTRQIRQPWGAMPRWSERQLPDQELADLYAFFTSLPRVGTPGVVPPGVPPDVPSRRMGTNNIGLPARITAPPNAPLGQRYAANTAGCAQCHGPEQRTTRTAWGSRVYHKYDHGLDIAQHVKARLGFTGDDEAVKWEYFKACVYDHEKLIPDARMGTYSRARLPEPIVREIYNFARSLGELARVEARLEPGVRSGDHVSYSVIVENEGTAQGVKPEDVSVELVLAPGVTVVGATGDGYQGVQRHPSTGRDVAVWKVPLLPPQQEQVYTVVVTGPGADKAISTMPREEQWTSSSAMVIEGLHSRIYWARPTTRVLPNMVTDPRRPAVGDVTAVNPKAKPLHVE
jgi:mono/diheme cytochrome c family protein